MNNQEIVISASKPDWTREQTVSGKYEAWKCLLKNIRKYQLIKGKKSFLNRFRTKILVAKHHFWSIVCGTDIPLNCNLGGGLVMPHPNGIVIHPSSLIGPNCLLLQQVTIGSRGDGFPIIGGHVDIGAGAKVLGSIKIGDHVKIGANSVVLHDVPEGATIVGIPAKIVKSAVK